jgi:hypothetical protein
MIRIKTVLAAAFALLSLCVGLAHGQFGGGAPTIDLYTLNDNVNQLAGNAIAAPYTSTSGKTSKSSSITGGEKTGVFIVAGQSLAGNHGQSLYTPSNGKAHLLNVYNGVVYDSPDPLMGASGSAGSWVSRFSDKLITAGIFTRVIVVPVAIAGTPIADWSPRGPLNQRLRVAYLRIRSLGWVGNADVSIGAILALGETDSSGGTSQANWQADFSLVKGTLDGLGFTGKWFVAKETMLSNATNSTIQAAQAAVVDNVRVFAGANTDSLTGGTNRIGDGTHLTDTGNNNNAALWQTVIAAQYPRRRRQLVVRSGALRRGRVRPRGTPERRRPAEDDLDAIVAA